MNVTINNQREFIAHAILLGYENRGESNRRGVFILAPPDGRTNLMPLLSVGADNVLFLSSAMAGSFYGHQEAFTFISDAAGHDYS